MRTATSPAPRPTSTSGLRPAGASTSPATIGTTPSNRQRVLQSAHHNPPTIISTNANVGMAGTRPTAPGSPATHAAHHTIASMPHPITQSGAASSPTGIATSVASAAGMTRMLQIGMATRLARIAKSCVLWKW